MRKIGIKIIGKTDKFTAVFRDITDLIIFNLYNLYFLPENKSCFNQKLPKPLLIGLWSNWFVKKMRILIFQPAFIIIRKTLKKT